MRSVSVCEKKLVYFLVPVTSFSVGCSDELSEGAIKSFNFRVTLGPVGSRLLVSNRILLAVFFYFYTDEVRSIISDDSQGITLATECFFKAVLDGF